MLTTIFYPDSNRLHQKEPLDESLINQMYELADLVMTPITPSEQSAEESYRMWREGFERNVAAGTQYILVIRDGILSGYLVFTSYYKGRDEILINDIMIHPKYQHDGVTLKNAVYRFLQEIADQTITIICAYVNKANHRAQDLMRKAGFQVERYTANGIRYVMLKRQFIERFDFLLEKDLRVI
jgi:ribosomal protein S18 acetylase RimI-like enzyme